MKSKEKFPILEIRKFQEAWDPDGSVVFHRFDGASSIEEARSHDFFVFLLFERGSGVHWIDFIDHPVEANQVHLLFPGQIHKWDLGKNTKGMKLIIDRRLFETFSSTLQFSFARFNQHSVLTLDAALFRKISNEFEAIEHELASSNIFWEIVHERARLIAMLVSRQAEKDFRRTISRRINPLLYNFLLLIDQHFREQKMVAFYAEHLFIVPNYLNILCKRQFKVSASSLIRQRILLEAKRLIQSTDMSIKEIGYSLGFKDLSSFSRFFKFHTGFSPKQYVKSDSG
ncbi:helix-turn-helix domain-containing protein [Chitinophaga vietnamensis]|uniref:helix-turn-helix domain-containing protein n=1 Tax=Chitinophaga vietnamensis TaxID=2593957 RepID=UPI001177896F|nr:AraC family transcriptional regulator [Chitinophaga vietnamensis]